MKRMFMCLTLLVAITTVNAQSDEMVKYRSAGGLKAGVNMSRLRFGDNVPSELENIWKVGVVGGLWYNFSMGKTFSIQPELLYSQMGGSVKGPFPGYNRYIEVEQKIDYVSIPLLIKANLGRNFALYAGPQLDARVSSKWKRSGLGEVDNKDSIRSTDFAVVGGIQLFPNSKFHLDLRYIHGLQDVWHKRDGGFYNQAFQATVGMRLFGKKIAPKVAFVPPVIVEVPDTDGDGIKDDMDKCPSVAGVAKYQGCPVPDTDGDGINDDNDKCPTQAGTAKYQGCPVPDSDGDGINDENDKCPTTAGLERYQGCPIPDTDGDGINDEVDKCKNTAGLADNQGCPEMVFYYKRDNATLTAAEKADLDKLVEWMGRHPELSVSIEGHTSTVGTAAYNQKLSEQRAMNTVKYLVSKGVDAARLKAVGHGENFPIGDNSKEEGRAQSRRVVMRIAQ